MLRPTLLLFALCYTGFVLAAENPAPQSQQVQQEPQPGQQESASTPTAEAADGAANGNEAPAADAAPATDEDSPARFIPTEEISQDLGVSFPVDI